jgi:hypothetical protein
MTAPPPRATHSLYHRAGLDSYTDVKWLGGLGRRAAGSHLGLDFPFWFYFLAEKTNPGRRCFWLVPRTLWRLDSADNPDPWMGHKIRICSGPLTPRPTYPFVCVQSLIFFFYFSILINISEMNGSIFFPDLPLLSYTSPSVRRDVYSGHASAHDAIVLHAGEGCATSTQPHQSRGHDSWSSLTVLSDDSVTPNNVPWLMRKIGWRPFFLVFSFSFFLLLPPLFTLHVAPLVICELSPLFGARGTINRLHDLVS